MAKNEWGDDIVSPVNEFGDEIVTDEAAPAVDGGGFSRSEPVTDTGDESGRLAARYPAPKGMSLADIRASEAAQPARFVRTEPEARMPAEKPVSVLQTEGMDQSRPWSFAEASRAQRANDDAQALYDDRVRRYGSAKEITGPDATPGSVARGLASDLKTGGMRARAGLRQMAADVTGAKTLEQSAIRERNQAELESAMTTPQFESETAQGIYGGVASTLRQAPSMAAGLATRNPGLALGGMIAPVVPDEYAKIRYRGGSPGEAMVGATGNAAAEYLTEKMPMSFLVEKFGKVGAGQFLAGVLAREVPGEQVSTITQDAIDTAVANPDKTWGEYLAERPGAAYQTLLATVTQSAITGGSSAGVRKLSEMARPVDRTPQIEALRKTGDETAASLLEQRQQKEQAAYSTEREAQALTQINPDLAQRYREVRMSGAKTGDAVVQTAARWNFEQAAQMAGLSPKAQEAISAKLAEMPAEKAASFVQKAITGLVQAGQAQPFDGMETLAQTIESQRDQMLDSVLATMNDIETLEQQDAAQDPAQAATAPTDAVPAATVPDGADAVSGGNEPGAVSALSEDWQQFPEQTGTLNVPRAEMPQVKTAHRGPLVNFLNARGVAHESVEVDPADLKPTQAEFSQTKVQEAADRDTDRSILISSDGHIIDGHHQALAKLEIGKPVRAIRLDAPAADLLPLVREFPSSTTEQTNVQDAAQGTEAQAAAGESAAPAAAPAPAPAPAQPTEGPGSDAGNGFKQGPKKGERYRVGVVAAAGGAVSLEKRLPAGTAATFYVGKDGNLIDGDSVNFIGDGKDRLWIPATPEQAQKAQAILDEMGRLELNDPARKDAKARLKALVQGKTTTGAPSNAADVARPGGQRADDRSGSNGAAGVPDQRPSDVLPSPGATAGQGVAGPGAAGGGTARPDALTEAPKSMMKPGFDSDAWQKNRDDRIKASREAGNTHLDTVPAYVETMRGKQIGYVHDPKVKGRILTVDNSGNVYVEWLDAYSQEKEGAVPMKYGNKTVMQTSLGPRDLKDYTLAAAPAAAPAAAGTRPAGVEADGLKQLADKAKAAQAETRRVGESSSDMDELQRVSEAEDAANDRLSGALEAIPDDRFGVQATTTDGRQIILTPSAQNPGQWQLTRFARDGAPWGDSQYTSKKSAILDFLREVDIGTLDAGDLSKNTPNLNTSAEPVQKTAETAQIEMLGQNSQPLSEGGKPFKTELAARKEKKLHPDKRVVKSPDGKGYVLKPMSAKQIAAQEAAARRIKSADTGETGPLSAHGFILSRGGLARSSMADAGFDKNVRIGNRWLFTDAGKTLAQAGEALKEAGYITEETENAASDVIRRSITSPQYTAEGWEAVAEAEAQTRFEDHLKAQQESEDDPFATLADHGYTEEDTAGTGYDEASPEIQAEVAALSSQLEAMGEDSESIRERVALQYPDATQQEYYEHVKAAITAAIAEAAQPAGRGDPGKDDGEQSQAREGTGESLTAEAAIRAAVEAVPNRTIGSWYPVTVTHNGRSQDFLSNIKRVISDGKGPQAIHLKQIKDGKLVASDPVRPLAYFYKLSRTNELAEEGIPRYADDADLKQWSGAFGTTESLTDRSDGTLSVKGDTKALRERLTAAGIPAKSILPSATGVVVGKTQAAKAREVLTQTLTAPTKSDIEAQQARTEQADKLDERAQVKRESEDGRDGGTQAMFSISDEKGERDLIVTHNLTPENVMHAIRMGGIPVPSMAVTKKDNALSSFGSITLIGKKEMADPKGYAKPQVFGADIYSPRYPNVEYKIEGAALRAINEKLRPFLDGGREIYGGELSRLDDLTSNKAFKRFAADKLGEADQNAVGYHELKGVASALIAESGAEERIFRGYTNSGNRKYIPHTLDNVVAILKKELRGGENFSYGVGSVRAKYTPKFSSVKDIRKGRDRLVTKEQFDAIKKEVDDEFFKIGDELRPFHGAGNSFGYSDAVALMMSDSAKMGIPRALEENGFEDVSPESMETIRDYLTKLRTLPTEYFEAKILRPVALAEFAAAVVPEKTSQEVIDAMRKEGITRIETYKDDADRKSVVRTLSESLRDDVLFSVDDTAKDGDTSPDATGPSTNLKDAQRAAIKRLERSIREQSGNAAYVLEPVEQVAGAGREFHFARNIVREAFGLEVTPVRQIGGRVFNGAQVGDHLLIDVRTVKPAMVVVGHELLHQLRRDDPQLYSFLKVQIERLLNDGAAKGYAETLRKRYEALGLKALNDDTAMEELLADIVGDQFGQREFWDAMGKKSTNRVVALARKVLEFFDKLLGIGREKFPFETDRYLKDIEAARQVVADVLAEYSGDKTGTAGADANLSIATQDQTETPAFKRWFGNSAVVDSAGKPLVVYHGTAKSFDAFDVAKRNGRQRYYFAQDPGVSSEYAGSNEGANVLPVFLSLQSPFELDAGGYTFAGIPLDGFPDAIVSRLEPKEAQRGHAGIGAIAKAAEDAGYDGILAKNLRDGAGKYGDATPTTIAVAFRPEQIKSATGNRGTFDPDNADIRFSIADKAPASVKAEKAIDAASPAQAEMFQPGFWDAPQETHLDKAIYELQDGRIDLKRVQEAITKAKAIPEKFDARLAETLYPGRVATRSEKFLNDEAKPLLDAMARNNVTMDDLADYLHARHAEERNKQIAKVNPDLPDGGAGKNSKGVLMTTEAAKQHIAGLSEGKRMVLAAMAKRVDAITQGTTKLLVDEGLEKQETIDAWTGAYKSYVPLFRDEAENGNPHPSGSGMSVRGSSSKRAVGSKKKATNILAHVLMQREAAITRAEKNRVAVALYGLALTNPNPDFWTTIKPSMSPKAIGQELQRMGVDPTVAEAGMQGVPTIKTVDPTLGRVISRPNPLYKSLPGAIVLKVNGEDRVLMVNTNDSRGLRMAENLKNLDGLTKFDIAGRVVGKVTRWMASVNTQYNPAFGLVNLTRDTLGGAINLSSTKLRGKTMKVLALTPGALKGIGLELSGKKSGEWGRLFRQFQADGGQTGFREQFKDANDRAKALESELKALEKSGKLSATKVAGKMLDALDIFNTTLENAVRLAAYKEALQEGMSRPEAARLGRELTVDFNRKGRMGRELGPLYAFFNASVQGTARTMQTLAGPAGAKIIAGGVSLGVLQAIMLLAAGYDDDEIPEFVKSRALIIPLGKDEEGQKRHLTIPLPLGLHVLPNTGRVLTELTLDGGKDATKKGFEAVGEIAGAFNPLGGGNIFTGSGFLRTLAPTIVDPFIETLSNENFAGAPIEREKMENDPRPGFHRARENTLRTPTGQTYTDISRIINTVTGGDEYEAGKFSPSPEMVRYWSQVVGGGLLREVEKIVNTSIAMSKGDETKPTGYPVLGRFYGEVDDESVQKTRYYENLAAIEKAEKMVKAAEKAGDLDAAQRIEEAKPEALLKKDKNRAQKDLRELNREAMETVGDRQAIKEIDTERTAVMRDLNTAARESDWARRDGSLGGQLRKALGLADVNP